MLLCCLCVKFNSALKGFSLIEISIVLLIIGVMLGSVMKGKSILEQAKIRDVVHEISRLQTAILLYCNNFGNDSLDLPGDIWGKLKQADLLNNDSKPKTKLGGTFSIKKEDGKKFLLLGSGENSEEAFLTPGQVKSIYSKLTEDGAANNEDVIIKDSSDKQTGFLEIKKGGKYKIQIVLQ